MANRLKSLAKDVLQAVLAATWIVGLVHQFGSWSTTASYTAISLAMVAVIFADHRILKLVLRRNRRR